MPQIRSKAFDFFFVPLQIPYSYSMEPYYAVPSRGLAAVMSVHQPASRPALSTLAFAPQISRILRLLLLLLFPPPPHPLRAAGMTSDCGAGVGIK